MAKPKRCPICREKVPRVRPGTRGPKPVYCDQTRDPVNGASACQLVHKARKLELAAQALVIQRTLSENVPRARRTLREGHNDQRAELQSELSIEVDIRNRRGAVHR